MIFVSLGTKRFKFDRLLNEIDKLVETGYIKDEVFGQIGHSSPPKNIEYKRFLNPQEYDEIITKSNLIITHGGTGAIIKALKAKKQTIAIPRLQKYGEHSDDHQLQIVNTFTNLELIKSINEISNLATVIQEIEINPIKKIFESNGRIIEIVDEFIKKN